MPNERKGLLERAFERWPAKVLSVAAAVMLFFLNRMSSLDQRFFTVPLEVRGSERFMPVTDFARTVRVTLRGDATALSFVDSKDIVAYVDLSQTVEEGEASFPVGYQRLRTALEADPLEVAVSPKSLRLKLESAETRVVSISPRFLGSPESGYERVDHQVSPPSAEIRGPRSLVAKIAEVYTAPVDLTGLKEDSSSRVALESPSPLVSLTNSSAVLISVTVKQAAAQKTFPSVPIMAKGLSARLALDGPLPEGLLKIQGLRAATEAFSLSADTFSVDLSSYAAPGAYTVPVVADVPADLIVVSREPDTVQVILRERGKE